MLLQSTVLKFADDVPEAQRDAYLQAVRLVTVKIVQLSALDKVGTLMNGETQLSIIDDNELSRVLSERNFPSTIVSDIRNRMIMITPVGERDAFLRFTHRTTQS